MATLLAFILKCFLIVLTPSNSKLYLLFAISSNWVTGSYIETIKRGMPQTIKQHDQATVLSLLTHYIHRHYIDICTWLAVSDTHFLFYFIFFYIA